MNKVDMDLPFICDLDSDQILTKSLYEIYQLGRIQGRLESAYYDSTPEEFEETLKVDEEDLKQ